MSKTSNRAKLECLKTWKDSLKIKSDMDLSNETFEKMIKFVEKKGYNVDLNKSVNWYDREEDKTVYPTIKLSKK